MSFLFQIHIELKNSRTGNTNTTKDPKDNLRILLQVVMYPVYVVSLHVMYFFESIQHYFHQT